MNPKTRLLKKRRTLLSRAGRLRQTDGTFAGEEQRQAFDTLMAEIEAIDEEIRQLDGDGDSDGDDDPAPTTLVPPDTRAAIIADEQTRQTGIRDAVRLAGLDPSVADALVGRNATLDAARADIFTLLAERSEQTPTRQHVDVVPGGDATDKWVRGVVHWLLVRTGMAGIVARHEGLTEADFSAGDFRGMSLLDLAKDSLQRRQIPFRGRDSMDVAGLAFRSNYQTTSDFSVALETAMHKLLQAAYGITPDTWSRVCGTSTVSDFRAHTWYRLGALSELDDLTEHSEFRNKAIPDAEKATLQAATKGNIIAVTRQVIVNDDIGMVMRLTQMLGRAAKLTIEKKLYTELAKNSNLGPTMSDSKALFHADHGNISTGAALAAAAIDSDRVQMALQKEPNSNEHADLRPAVLLLPVGLGGNARVINTSQYDPDTVANKSQMKPNIVVGLFRDVVDTPRLSGTRRYLFADPEIAPVFVVSFLEGQREPVLETQDGWRTDGVEMKARLDFGIDAVDYRGAVTNAGA